MFAGQGEPQVLGEALAARSLAEYRAAQLAVVGPGAPVDVARADRDPGVVDDADLRVDVDGGARVVFHVVDTDPVTAQPLQQVQRPGTGEQLGRDRGTGRPEGLASAGDGEPRHDGDQPQAGPGGEGLGEAGDDRRAPQVLVFQVHQALSPAQRLAVTEGDAALARRRKGVPSAPVRVCTQDLHRISTASLRVG